MRCTHAIRHSYLPSMTHKLTINGTQWAKAFCIYLGLDFWVHLLSCCMQCIIQSLSIFSQWNQTLFTVMLWFSLSNINPQGYYLTVFNLWSNITQQWAFDCSHFHGTNIPIIKCILWSNRFVANPWCLFWWEARSNRSFTLKWLGKYWSFTSMLL